MKEAILKLIKQCIDEYGFVVKIGGKFNNVFRHYPEYKQWLNENTPGSSLVEQLFLVYNHIDEIPVCKQCGTNKVRFINFIQGYKDCCCGKCTTLFKYGVENTSQVPEIKEKFLKTLKSRYGGIGTAGKQIAEKRNATIISKYNGNYQQTAEYKEKCKLTNIEKYGAEHFMKTEEGKEKYLSSRDYKDPKFIDKCKALYPERNKVLAKGKRDKHFKKLLEQFNGRWTPLFSKDEYFGTHFKHKYPFRCESCKTEFEMSLFNFHRDRTLTCPTCKQTNKSMIQHEFAEEIKQLRLGLIVQEEKLGILSGKKSLDIFLPELNLAIEYNGNIWHTHSYKQDKLYHYVRFQECKNSGVKYVAFWSDEYAKYKKYILNIISGFLADPIEEKLPIKFKETEFNKEMIFFTHRGTSDKFISYNYGTFQVVFKYRDKQINDVYCSDWEKVNQFEYIGLEKFNFECDNRLLCLFQRFLDTSKLHCEERPVKFYKLLKSSRSLKLLEKTNSGTDVIYSYGTTILNK